MPSPFPGFDPYLVPHWSDVRLSLAVRAASLLNQALPPDLVARMGVHEVDCGPADTGPLPLKRRWLIDRQIWVLDRDTLVTIICFLAPEHRMSGFAHAYARHVRSLLDSGVSVLHIDLTRIPGQITMRSGATEQSHALPLGRELPAVAVALRRGDPPVTLELRPLIDDVYASGRYTQLIDYKAPPGTPLDPDDAIYADQLLRSAGKR